MKDKKICIIGLGYVGLPLAIEFSKYYKVSGFDINSNRISQLSKGIDYNDEIDLNKGKKKNLKFSDKEEILGENNIFVITVPTPVFSNNKPNLKLINKATKLVGKFLKKNDYVIYESTVYPGFTDEVSIPILERTSGLKVNSDFVCGYSPERINPGDKNKKLTNIIKIVSASSDNGLKFLTKLYGKIINAGIHNAESIKIAESAKIIENSQRDINIAFVNELMVIFKKLDIDIYKVLNAANTKWNFLNFVPGLVGGHCIGVDPYYLAFKANQIGYEPKILLSGRKINNEMPKFYSKLISNKLKKPHKNKKILILGATFKENCKDLRNSKIEDLCVDLLKKNLNVKIFDPLFKINQIFFEKTKLINQKPKKNFFDCIVLAVSHDKFKKYGLKNIKSWGKKDSKIIDIKGIFSNDTKN